MNANKEQDCHPQPLALRCRDRPVEEGRSSHTRLVRGVRRLQSPSEWTEDTDDGLSTPDRPGAGDLALRPLDRPLPLEDFPPPASTQGKREGCLLRVFSYIEIGH